MCANAPGARRIMFTSLAVPPAVRVSIERRNRPTVRQTISKEGHEGIKKPVDSLRLSWIDTSSVIARQGFSTIVASWLGWTRELNGCGEHPATGRSHVASASGSSSSRVSMPLVLSPVSRLALNSFPQLFGSSRPRRLRHHAPLDSRLSRCE